MFHLFQKLYSQLYISHQVHEEVVVAGAGLPGASEVAQSKWIEVKGLKNQAELPAAKQQFPFGDGELSTILLAKELAADRVLLDDYGARKLARAEGLKVAGSVGILEESYRRGHLADLRAAFQQLITHHVYIDRRLLERRLRSLGLPPL